MKDPLKVAVVGCGIGVAHVKAWKSLPDAFTIHVICDLDRAKADATAREFEIPHVETDFDALLKRDDIDVVDLCTPPHLHAEQIEKAYGAGKHVICEKPLAGSIDQVDRLIALEAGNRDRRIMPIFQYRFGAGMQKLRALQAAGLAGKAYLSTVETSWRRGKEYYDVPWRGKWKSELGGVILGHAIHAHDLFCCAAGPIKSVYARLATRVNPIEVEDCLAASLEMEDGSLATLAATLGSTSEITRHRFCYEGFVAESNTRPYSNSGDPWTFTGDTDEVRDRIEDVLSTFEELPEGYAGQFLRFHRALRDGSEIPVTLQDARASLELITALYFSDITDVPVSLPLGRDHPFYKGWIDAKTAPCRG